MTPLKIYNEFGILSQCPNCKTVFIDKNKCDKCNTDTDEICQVVLDSNI